MYKEILNPREGKQVGTVVWPFYRYSALIPKQIGADLFVWLYLSLIIQQNQMNGLAKDCYTEEIKRNVETLILGKFSSVIDRQTFEKIRANAERDFTVATHLKEETFSFVDTYENLFSDKLDVRYIYQDAITGEVVPFFGDSSHIEESDSYENSLKNRPGIPTPHKLFVRKAYEHYMRLKMFSAESEAEEIQEALDLFYDEDAQTFFDDEFDMFEEEEAKPEQKSLKNYNVIFLENSRVLLDLAVPVFVRGNELLFRSPFDRMTDQWFNRCVLKAKNVFEEAENLIKELSQKYLIPRHEISEYIEARRADFASNLQYCDVIYRLLEPLNDSQLMRDVISLEESWKTQNMVACYHLGRILDALVRDHIHCEPKTSEEERKETEYEEFCLELDARCQGENVDISPLKRKAVWRNWREKKVNAPKQFVSFKADIADIVLRTNLLYSDVIYPSFFEDLFVLYDSRSKADHADRTAMLDPDMIKKLEKTLKVLNRLL